MDLTVAPELGDVLAVGVLRVDDTRVVAHEASLDAPLAEAERRLRDAPDRSETVTAVRQLYRAVGLDPTKTRPSSEALLRRIRKGEGLPRINGVVDVGNWCSAETQLPFGLYDVDRIEGPIEVRVGRAGEEYAGIGKDVVHVAGRITLADRVGPFGNPTSDSARTRVSETTARVLVVVYAPRPGGVAAVARALALTATRLEQFTGGTEVGRQVI
jgi:DNA/RNA-binding domain of Phe-tRNA-synthetase-like protein